MLMAYVVTILFMLENGTFVYHEEVALYSPIPVVGCIGQQVIGYNHNTENKYECFDEEGNTITIRLSGYNVL